MRFPPAGWAWPPGPRVAAAHNSGVDGRRDGREKGPMQAASGPQRDKTRPAARLGGPPGTKLSQQAALAGPPGTKLSQRAPKRRFRPTFRMQGELFTASATNNPSRENFIPHAGPLPVQNSPSKRPWQAHPVQNSPSTPGSTAHPVQNSPSKRPWQAHPVQNSPSKPQNADFGPLFACRENFVPLPTPTTRAGRTLSRMRCHFRYKTLPARPARRPTRYKTLPASGSAAHPVQNSPSKPQNADFGPLFACRENFVPLPPPTRQAGRKKSRTNTPPHPPTRPSPNFACNSIE